MADDKNNESGPELYDVQLSKIDFESPLYKKHGPKVEKLADKLDDDLRNAFNKYANGIMKLRDAAACQNDPAARKLIDQYGFERGLVMAGSLFADLIVKGHTTPAYAYAFFVRLCNNAADIRAELEAEAAAAVAAQPQQQGTGVREIIEWAWIQATTAKSPNN